MDNIQADLVSIAAVQTIAIEVYSRTEAVQIAARLRQKFGDARNTSVALWEALIVERAHYGACVFEVAKQRLQTLAGPLSLLIDDWHGHSAISVATGAGVIRLLEESYGFVWYVTDVKMTFILCKNDHDFLIYGTDDQPRTS